MPLIDIDDEYASYTEAEVAYLRGLPGGELRVAHTLKVLFGGKFDAPTLTHEQTALKVRT